MFSGNKSVFFWLCFSVMAEKVVLVRSSGRGLYESSNGTLVRSTKMQL